MLFPQSTGLLIQQNITHVLSLTNARNCPQIQAQTNISHLHVDIEDNPMEDLLVCLDGLCAWIAHALGTGAGSSKKNNAKDEIANTESVSRKPKVLVHCIQGISRSGSIIVAYLMRSLAISYDDALRVARKYRPSIAPNSGFAEQLRVWERLECAVLSVKATGGETEVIVKSEYEEWKGGRGILLSRVEAEKEKARMNAMRLLVQRCT